MRAAARILVLLGAVLWLAGCGYRLAGSQQLAESLSPLRIVTQNFSDAQARSLRLRLEQAGARVAGASDAAAAQLDITWLEPADRQIVASASNGKTVKRISRGLRFSLRDAGGATLLANRTLSQESDIQLDDDNLLASDQERASLADDLQRALFEQLIRQLNRI